ncbi:MAG: hypothetical protein VX737_01535 [Pseudomonadota bacterium]|nr:hypothetical protein [Pseudomonadota bacterium]
MKTSIENKKDQRVLAFTEGGNKPHSHCRSDLRGIKVDIPGQGISGLVSRVKEHNELHEKGELAAAQQVIDRAVNPSVVKSAIVIERSMIVAGKVGARAWARAKELLANWREQEPLFVREESADEVGSCELRSQSPDRRGVSFLSRFFRNIFSRKEAEDNSDNPFANLSQARKRDFEPDSESELGPGLVSV